MTTTKVQSEFIAADAVTGAKIADDAIDSEHYTDGSIDTAHIADNAITSAKIAAGVVIASDIADDSIDSQHYVAASIDNEHLADDAVDSDEIAAGAIDLAHMSANSIDSDQYVDGSIDAAHLAPAQTNITSLGTLTGLTGGTGDFNWDSNTLFVDSSASMVGIGTSSPAVELHVDQAAGQITEIRASAATVYSKLIADDATGFNVLDFSHTLYVKEAGATIGTLAAGNWSLPNKLGVGNTDLLAACITATDTTARAPATSGNVTGHVVLGKKADSSLAMGSYSTGGYSWLQAAAADSAGTVNKLVLNPIGGNVGIGGTPGVLFDIQGASGGDEVIRFGGSGTTDNRGLGLDLSGATYELSIGYPSHGTGRFAIGTWDRTTFSEKFCIDTSSGNVGIGMGNNGVPAYLLDVAGTVDVNNLTIATAQGSDGQLLTSTGSGVGWEDAPSSGISMGKAIAAAIVFG